MVTVKHHRHGTTLLLNRTIYLLFQITIPLLINQYSMANIQQQQQQQQPMEKSPGPCIVLRSLRLMRPAEKKSVVAEEDVALSQCCFGMVRESQLGIYTRQNKLMVVS
jgi:hypothetical protein